MYNDTASHSALLGAIVGAGGYDAHLESAAQHVSHEAAERAARHDVQMAQVELYCDHRAQALVAIRHAMQLLESCDDKALEPQLAKLSEAAWHVRHNESLVAVDLLDEAKVQLHS
ncbi:hypothetical protein [Pseudorhodoferax sp. Leaf274]|uniref:hypothetical protein n=1 Tax=Pseudorhodoferax sp. Leaf274 TaxID=1736318 RepID=UPI000702A0D4|nr:hypothetical protein [Pseudorhodoferax sp. Leaf274]KQP49247.1 hypothetical protein ASF44_01085 [Pseudorhodoferax sp. Leaf274]